MDAIQFIVKQAEGLMPLPAARLFDNWADAADTLRTLCLEKERNSPGPLSGYWKTDVKIVFSDGSWERRRFDAEKSEINTARDLEFFRRNTLLWERGQPERPACT